MKKLLTCICIAGALTVQAVAVPAPRRIDAGVVLVDFEDLPGDVGSLSNAFEAVSDRGDIARWFHDESRGRLDLRLHPHRTNAAGLWIRAPRTYAWYCGQPSADVLFDDLVQHLPPEPEWETICLAFPLRGGRGGPQPMGPGFHGLRRWGGRMVTCVNLGDYDYGDHAGEWGFRWRSTVHEIGHALGLPDLYSAGQARSYGWSMMSDMRTGWHFLEWERYRQGWLGDDGARVVKGNTDTVVYPAVYGSSPAPGPSLLLVPLPGREAALAVEVAKGLGRKPEQRDAWLSYDLVGNGAGVLIYRVPRPVPQAGPVAPLVLFPKRAGGSPHYGGAAYAAHLAGDVFRYDDITLSVGMDLEGGAFEISVRRDRTYRPREVLRQGEVLGLEEFLVSKSGKHFAVMQGDGNLCVYKGDRPWSPGNRFAWGSAGDVKELPKGAWAFYACLSKKGILEVRKGTGLADDHGPVWAYPAGKVRVPAGTNIGLVLEEKNGTAHLAVRVVGRLSRSVGRRLYEIR